MAHHDLKETLVCVGFQMMISVCSYLSQGHVYLLKEGLHLLLSLV